MNIEEWRFVIIAVIVGVFLALRDTYTEVFICDIEKNSCKIEHTNVFHHTSSVSKPSPNEIKDIKIQHTTKRDRNSRRWRLVDAYFLYLETTNGKRDRIFSGDFRREENAIKAAEDINKQLASGVNPVIYKFKH